MSGRRNILRTEYSGSRGRRSPLAETCQAQHILAYFGIQMSFKRMLQTSMHVHQKDALNIHAYASPDHYFVCLAFARSPKKIQATSDHPDTTQPARPGRPGRPGRQADQADQADQAYQPDQADQADPGRPIPNRLGKTIFCL